MLKTIEAPRLGERPDAGLAQLALTGVLQGDPTMWHDLPSDVRFSLAIPNQDVVLENVTKAKILVAPTDHLAVVSDINGNSVPIHNIGQVLLANVG